MVSFLKVESKMNKKYKCFIILFISVLVALNCYAEPITGKPIFIDSRLMVLVHPLFGAYDTSTGRFKGTPSEP